ncbi:MAG: hydroxymethylglutaryl-CoA lyase, partial [Geminicoccaceae bacterium]
MDFAEIVEVSPRDGIQNEPKILSTSTKLALIQKGIDAGLKRFEVTSFVNPKRVPQMADAEAVAAGLPKDIDARYIGLTLNKRGFDRAVAAGLHEANFVVVTSDSFCRRNQGMSTEDSIAAFAEASAGAGGKIDVGVTVAAAFGCPFEGEVPLARLMQVVEACMEHRPFELALADTIGVATPRDIKERVGAVRAAFPDLRLRLHLHNTRNTGIANA